MSAAPPATEPHANPEHHGDDRPVTADTEASTEHAPTNTDPDAESEEEEDEEPRLKYAKLTSSLQGVYRNGDSTSAFWVGGDRMVVGTHNGNIHVLSVPELKLVRNYRAHQASVTGVSVSPVPPAPTLVKTEAGGLGVLSPPSSKASSARNAPPASTGSQRTPKQPQQQPIPATISNQIYIATSSIDGHVCVSSLTDQNDVQLRNFARPVSAVALSPQYKSDRVFLSGGLAGQLILTTGGATGRTVDANTNSAAATATGWMSSFGLAKDNGRDQALHQGEGKISEIRWSLSGKWVCWVNEEGIKIMRSHLNLGEQSEDAWRRIAHAGKPNRKGWVDMAGVWKARVEWVNERHIESEEMIRPGSKDDGQSNGIHGNGTVKSSASTVRRAVEKLVVGWGDTAWILNVQQGTTADTGQKRVGSADIIHKLQFRDCIVSGISLYTPSMLAILAYRTRDDDDKPIQQSSAGSTSKKGRSHRHTGLTPQLRLVDTASGEEVDLDEIPMSRSETLSAQDYHFGTLFLPSPPLTKAEREQKGNLEAMWELSGGAYATKLFSSSASVLSRSSSGLEENGKASSFASPSASGASTKGGLGVTPTPDRRKVVVDAHPYALEPGLKLFIQSPYDCVLAVKRDLNNHLEWLLEHRRYADAWNLLDEHPEVVPPLAADQRSFTGSTDSPSTPSRTKGTLADFFADDANASESTLAATQAENAAVHREKRRIGELWLQQLVNASDWAEAGKVAGKVLGTSIRWEHWVWTFAQAGKFDEITPYIPSTSDGDDVKPLPSLVYEVVLGHYIVADRERLKDLLDMWEPELFDVRSVISAIENQLDSGSISEESVEDGEKGRDWRSLMNALAKLYLADGRAKEALRCYIRVQNADAAMALIREEKLLGAVAEDVPSFLMLRVSKDLMKSASLQEMEELSSEAVTLLVEEAHRGTVPTATVVRQLERKGPFFQPFLFFYFRALWNSSSQGAEKRAPRGMRNLGMEQGHALVEDHADLAVSLFAEYDRDLLMALLRASTIYSYDKAAAICEQRHYIPELVYVLSKTGQTKRALFLIIGELGDVKQAIEFCRENGAELWQDLLDYAMDKPQFIRGLLEEVGTAVDPIELVRRIPEGLEIEGLRDGVIKMVREFDIQFEISEGVARVLRGEVGMGMDTLRAGQKKAVRFEVLHSAPDEVDLAVRDPPTTLEDGEEILPVGKRRVKSEAKRVKPGHCVGCGDVFHEEEKEPLIGFACGHVYHLTCLLRANPDTADEATIDRLMGQLGFGEHYEQGEDNYTGRSVGGKVAHAHIVKNVVRGGCRCCIVPDGA